MSSLPIPDRLKSPRSPSHSLEKALEFVARIYEGVHRSPVDSVTALKLMGFAGKSGASASALGSVRQYGLIEGIGDRTRVSDLALSILEPISDGEKISSLKTAAKQPQVFNQIFERFGGRLPNADEPLRAFLIRELGFSKNGADDSLSALRATQSYVDSLGAIDGREFERSLASQDVDDVQAPASSKSVPASGETNLESDLMVVPLTRHCRVEMRFYGEISERALNKLARYIELLREDWVEE